MHLQTGGGSAGRHGAELLIGAQLRVDKFRIFTDLAWVVRLAASCDG